MSALPSEIKLLDQALNRGNLANAWMYAHSVPVLTLDRALRLTILLGLEEGHRSYPAAARRFLRRFIRECEPTLEQVKRVADALDCLANHPHLRLDARDALQDLARQLAEKREPACRWVARGEV